MHDFQLLYEKSYAFSILSEQLNQNLIVILKAAAAGMARQDNAVKAIVIVQKDNKICLI